MNVSLMLFLWPLRRFYHLFRFDGRWGFRREKPHPTQVRQVSMSLSTRKPYRA